ncbi:RsmE family RNA methyltransferase [Schleiferia thermophila]|jgi:16S rRNA (uracil1498-N3)-methyltransferase|uniref:RsmE family RNA methyltransferase n=1 Tax=Schleiferia thermophila TaxID=884107 RepID=UPI000A003486|nr:RsmE family RNA methyltransferase [Schleiferia thermophila]PMB36326.1 hypothetical protein CEN47_08590 [Fischerella thermalis CCMEE 5319]
MNLFFAQPLHTGTIQLDPEESHHLVKVLRLQTGEPVLLTDGRGLLAKGVVLDTHPKSTTIEVTELNTQPNHHPQIHLFTSPTRTTDRTEWLIEKATELGVASLNFVQCQRTARSKFNIDRYHRISQAACKQSLNPYFPHITYCSTFQEAIAHARGLKALATCAHTHKTPITAWSPDAEVVSLYIGPEGDFTPAEISAALHSGASIISLGSLRLRTETAAIAALSFLRLRNL